MLIKYTSYSCLLINVLCQHSNVDVLPLFRWKIPCTSLTIDNDAASDTVMPVSWNDINIIKKSVFPQGDKKKTAVKPPIP
ncbi:hypothetical protein GJ496_006261 [Pomphorhynchus laevis]|nr:hypothetical protein GJ496_006261 [Pomphorhynchus laevis]